MARSDGAEEVQETDPVVEEMLAALLAPDVRLEVGFALTVTGGVQVVRICRRETYTTKGGAWRDRHVQVGPMLVAPEDAPTRAGLLRQLADMIDAAEVDRG